MRGTLAPIGPCVAVQRLFCPTTIHTASTTCVEVDGRQLFWKIDYFDAAMEFGSEDPADPSKTTRVLTIMLSSEY